MTPIPQPSFLVELMNPATGEIEETDICAKLSLAVEKVYLHLQDYSEIETRVEVSYDDEQQLEGVGFFDAAHNVISCVTVYRLERDNELPTVAAIDEACRTAGIVLEERLNMIFKGQP